jgi:uncharacterized membrane protein YecN with MAPEG domain
MQITLPITLTIAAAAALINLWLATRVSQLRFRDKVSIGEGSSPVLATRMRAHANFVEYTPFFLILLALVELSQGSKTWLWGVAIVYILARLAHPFGMDRKAPNMLRMIGILLTWAVLLGLAVYALAIPYIEGARTPASYSTTA